VSSPTATAPLVWTARVSPDGHDRRALLSAAELRALEAITARRTRWPREVRLTLTRLIAPIDEVLALVEPGRGKLRERGQARSAVILAMGREQRSFWGFDPDGWLRALRATDPDVRQLVMAVAHMLCAQRDLHSEFPGFKRGLFARRVFGAAAVDASLARIQAHLDGLGRAATLARPSMQSALYELMLRAGSPLLEDLALDDGELVRELHAREHNNARRYGLEQVARTLAELGVLHSPPFAAQPTREEWLARSRAGEREVPGDWLDWTRRWFLNSTLSRRSREHGYYTLIKAGRWLGREHPDRADPRSWTRELAAAWIAAVDQLRVGDFSYAPNTNAFRARRDGPLAPRTKAQHISYLGTFFFDLQEWEWIERRFDPRRAFTVPRSIQALIGPDPRVIADDAWAKLLWAGLNLTSSDLPIHATTRGAPWYPLELVQAVALLWLFGGLRVDEILRLRVGAVRWQHANIEAANNSGADRAVCLLDVPTNKTGPAFTKPVDQTVGEALERWQQLRPAQPKFPDEKTGERVDLLFAWRGARIGKAYINRSVIPILCAKAGVPRSDVRGTITSHRARATIASQLYNAKDPMTLFELQAWLGHRSPHSTQHYARITPTTLAKAYTDAGYFGRNLRAIEILLDRDAIRAGATAHGEPFEFYDLGHGYCTYSFFEQCPHRMACARCDFYLPKSSTEAQLLEAKTGLQRMLVEIPLTDSERCAVEDDADAVERLIDLLKDVPTSAGPTPRQLEDTAPGEHDNHHPGNGR
jgi:site-specific recombinase XerD